MRLEGVGGLLGVFAGLKHRKKTVHTATPPTKQGKDNNFAIAAASQFKCTEELRSSDTHRQTEDCRCYPTEEPTKGEQSLLSSALYKHYLLSGVWLNGLRSVGETKQSYFRGVGCFVLPCKGRSSILLVWLCLLTFACAVCSFNQSCNTRCMTITYI